ncbi:hypothetical protein [Tenacibaculum sp.]|uniref:hypothetical protein n=1 Tax=Tenacibaculum sp. TaxID=1906242 RepID=UPI003D103E78
MKNLNSRFSLFHESLIRCEIYDTDGLIGTYKFKAEYVFLFLLSDLYSNFPKWQKIKTWWDYNGSSIGYLENNEDTKNLIDKMIKRSDWKEFHVYDFELIAVVKFKNTSEVQKHQIKKSDLETKFIHTLYNLYDDTWSKFLTRSLDGETEIFPPIKNTYNLKRKKTITSISLMLMMKDEAIKPRIKPPKVFYLLYFENKPFIKIGFTTNLKFRLFNYLYPQSDSELYFYENAEIDFTKSIIVISNEAKKIETQMKQRFKSSLTFTKEKGSDFTSDEILNKDCYNSLLFELKEYDKKYLATMLDYNNSSQLKSVLEALGVIKNASHLLANKKPYLPFSVKYSL